MQLSSWQHVRIRRPLIGSRFLDRSVDRSVRLCSIPPAGLMVIGKSFVVAPDLKWCCKHKSLSLSLFYGDGCPSPLPQNSPLALSGDSALDPAATPSLTSHHSTALRLRLSTALAAHPNFLSSAQCNQPTPAPNPQSVYCSSH